MTGTIPLHDGAKRSAVTSFRASGARPCIARPVRVCFMIDRLTTGGTETQLLQLIANLDRLSVEPFLCLLDGDDSESRAMEPANCEVVRLGVRVLRRFTTLRAAFRLAKTLRIWGVDVIQVHFPESTYVGVLAAKLAGVPWVVRPGTTSSIGSLPPTAR